jgi:hypothetical protein
MKITFQAPDFKKAIATIEGVEEKKIKEIELDIKDSVDQMVKLAKAASPINESRLRNSISAEKISPLQYEFVAQTKYAAFMEFGTKTLVDIPPGAEEIAAEAQKIKGGTMAEFEANIRRWVKLKGLAGTYSVKTRRRTGSKANRQREDDSVVFLIMRKILKVGVKPHPFFFPAIRNEVPKLAKKLTKIVTK